MFYKHGEGRDIPQAQGTPPLTLHPFHRPHAPLYYPHYSGPIQWARGDVGLSPPPPRAPCMSWGRRVL